MTFVILSGGIDLSVGSVIARHDDGLGARWCETARLAARRS